MPANTTPRFDIYAIPHKGLRLFMSDTQLRVGTLDPDDRATAEAVIGQVRTLLTTLRDHLDIENEFVLPEIEARRPGATTNNAHDHRHHERTITSLGDRTTALERAIAAGADNRNVLAHQLYLELSAFVADNLLHMMVEETELNAILWELFSDEEIVAMHHRIVASESPEQLAGNVRWIIPALTPAERTAILAGARPSMPAPVFDQLVELARSLLPQHDWLKLAAALDAA